MSFKELFKFHGISSAGDICLAFLKSCLEPDEETYFLVESAYSLLPETELDNEWSKGYSLLFLGMSYRNLGYFEKSSAMFQDAISYAEKSHYIQVKAKALSGLAEIYREQQEFEMALSHHAEAVSLLDKIGAKCDFAGALFQRALTYQAMGETEKSAADFGEAIRLFTEMNAPRQVERVQQAMKPITVQAQLNQFDDKTQP